MVRSEPGLQAGRTNRLAALPAELRLGTVGAAVALLPAVEALLGLGAVVLDVPLLPAPPAHLRLGTVGGHVALGTRRFTSKEQKFCNHGKDWKSSSGKLINQ